jgi:hypothetical protein
MANLREIMIGFGKNKQDDIGTANTAAGMWRLDKVNPDFMNPKPVKENNAQDLGKGHEFATQEWLVSWDVQGTIEKYLTAEFAAWVMAYSLGHTVKSGSTPNWIYTCTPLVKATDGDELPYFSYVEQIRPGESSAVVDRMMVGLALNGWTLSVTKGPGRANSKLVAQALGCGLYTEPSAITLPAATAEKSLLSAGLACTIVGVNYVSVKDFESLEATYNNNLKLGFYPGSGYQDSEDGDSGAVAGYLEVGDREVGLSFVTKFKHGSTELTKMREGTEGTAVFSLTNDTNNSLSMTYQRVTYGFAELGEQDGSVIARVTCTPMYHSSNGLLTAVAKCGIDGIAEEEA